MYLNAIWDIENTKFPRDVEERLCRKWFCENVGNLIFAINMLEDNITFLIMIPKEVMANFNMFSARM